MMQNAVLFCCVISLINYFVKFSHQEKLLLEGEKYLQSKEDLRLMLTELKKKQEVGFALQPGLQEKKAQLKIYKKFLQKAQDLTFLLEELKSQGNYLLECTKNPNFMFLRHSYRDKNFVRLIGCSVCECVI